MNRKEVERKERISDSLFKFLNPKKINLKEVKQLSEIDEKHFPLSTYRLQFKSANNSRTANGLIQGVTRWDQNSGPESVFYAMKTDNAHLSLTSLYEIDYGDTWYVIRED
jgi:hypothetical protein